MRLSNLHYNPLIQQQLECCISIPFIKDIHYFNSSPLVLLSFPLSVSAPRLFQMQYLSTESISIIYSLYLFSITSDHLTKTMSGRREGGFKRKNVFSPCDLYGHALTQQPLYLGIMKIIILVDPFVVIIIVYSVCRLYAQELNRELLKRCITLTRSF